VQGDDPGTTASVSGFYGFSGTTKISVNPWKEEKTGYSGFYQASALDGQGINYLWLGYEDGLSYYNGSSWAKRSSYSVRDIKMVSSTKGWATTGLDDNLPKVLKYNGTSWEVLYNPIHTGAFNKLSYIDAYGYQWLYIAADNRVLRYDGTTWETFTTPSSKTYMAVSNLLTLTDMWAVGQDGSIIRSSGSAWSEQSSPATNYLNDILMLGLNNGWAVGDNGTIIHWDGSSWQSVSSPTTNDLYTITFKSLNEGWIGGKEVLLYYNGSVWQVVGDYSGKEKTITKLMFLNDGNGAGIINSATPQDIFTKEYNLLKYKQ